MESKLHILIVDDDNRIRNLLKDYLSRNSYFVSTAENAEQAKINLEYLAFHMLINVHQLGLRRVYNLLYMFHL